MGFRVTSHVRGLSDESFLEAFDTEEHYCSVSFQPCRLGGLVCPACGHRGHGVLSRREAYQFSRCRKQPSPMAGTIFHATKLSLKHWSAAIHMLLTAENGILSI